MEEIKIQATKTTVPTASIIYATHKFEKEYYNVVALLLQEDMVKFQSGEVEMLDIATLDKLTLNYIKVGQVLADLGYISPNTAPDSLEKELIF